MKILIFSGIRENLIGLRIKLNETSFLTSSNSIYA